MIKNEFLPNLGSQIHREQLEKTVKDGRHNWAKMGFLSRFVVFTYSYGISTVTQILKSYSEHGINLNNTELTLPDVEVDIALPEEIADKLDP